MQQELTPEALAAIEKVGKLLALARDARGNEHEAQNALDMAHRILEAHNLDMALVERNQGTAHAKRDDKTSGGGLYRWQRTVWESTAKLNMCVYFSLKGLERGSKYENRLVGKPENVLMTTLMAEYLVDTIERIAAEWVADTYGRGTSRFIREAIVYREGMADTIGRRLGEMHEQRIQEAKDRQEAGPTMSGGKGIALNDVIEQEEDLNTDFLRGLEPGTTNARRMERKAAEWRAHVKSLEDAERRKLWKSDPDMFRRSFSAEEVAKQVEKDAYDADVALWRKGIHTKRFGKGYDERTYYRNAGRGSSYRETEADRRRASPAFREGAARGEQVSLHSQVDQKTSTRIR